MSGQLEIKRNNFLVSYSITDYYVIIRVKSCYEPEPMAPLTIYSRDLVNTPLNPRSGLADHDRSVKGVYDKIKLIMHSIGVYN